MAYSKDTARVARQLEDAVALARESGVAVYGGLGAHLLVDAPQTLAEQLEAARAAGTDAVVIFSHDALLGSPGVRDVLTAAWAHGSAGR